MDEIYPARVMVVGYPGAGKTGLGVSLINAGFKVRILDYDGNTEPLRMLSDPEKFAKNVDIAYLADDLRGGGPNGALMDTVGLPSAFASGFKLMDNWVHKDRAGNTVDLGSPKDWGPDTVVILDSTTSQGQAAMIRASKMQNRAIGDNTDRVYGQAMGEQEQFIKRLASAKNKFHVIVLSHLRIIGPKDIRKGPGGDSDIMADIKRTIADIIPTKLCPSVLGWQYPQTVAKDFPTVLLAYRKVVGKKVKRYLTSVSGEELDLKFPGPEIPLDSLEIQDGMLHVFKVLSPGAVALVSGEGAAGPATEEKAA